MNLYLIVPVALAGLVILVLNYFWHSPSPPQRKIKFAIGVIVLAGGTFTSVLAAYRAASLQWATLNRSQITSLAELISRIPSHEIMVGCATMNCRELSDDFVEALNKGGWKASLHLGGGLGIDGVLGLRLDQAGPDAAALQKAIKDATGLNVDCVPVPPNFPTPEVVDLTVGTKPF